MASAGPYASLHLAPDRQPRQHPTTQFFTGRMPFMPPNQQRQSPDGKSQLLLSKGHSKHFSMLCAGSKGHSKHFSMLCAGSLTTENCSVAVFKSRLKTFLFSPGSLSSLFSAAHCLAPAPLKLQPYGTIDIRLLLFFYPRYHIIIVVVILIVIVFIF